MAYNIVGPFSLAIGIPTGGCIFAKKLNLFANDHGPIIICDDVTTTGESMKKMKHKLEASGVRKIKGITVFARKKVDSWIIPMFQYYQT